MLENLEGKTFSYVARDRGPMKDKMEQNCLAPSILKLKLNAQVMLLKNQAGGGGGLVNGSIGVVIGFSKDTAHNENQPGANGERKGSLNTPGEELPQVRFTLEGGVTRDMVVGREEWSIELPNGTLQGARIQIPLGLAWSLSIHKSQGQTLPKVRVDLGKVFEKGNCEAAEISVLFNDRYYICKYGGDHDANIVLSSCSLGQAYVALSRATTLEGLQVLNFDRRKVMVHPKVTEFYKSLRVFKRRVIKP